jgi:hypothetical protein
MQKNDQPPSGVPPVPPPLLDPVTDDVVSIFPPIPPLPLELVTPVVSILPPDPPMPPDAPLPLHAASGHPYAQAGVNAIAVAAVSPSATAIAARAGVPARGMTF